VMTEQHLTVDDYRVQFDFEIGFSNGGGIQGQGFRLDIDGDDISDAYFHGHPFLTLLPPATSPPRAPAWWASTR
jgi:hypothetical protein